jgi:hypothetical protein
MQECAQSPIDVATKEASAARMGATREQAILHEEAEHWFDQQIYAVQWQ